MDVLVGHATAHGSTRQFAERMAAELRRAGLTARARPMAEVDDADAYEAFVLGSAVHSQRWLTPARAFLRDNRDLLGMRPVWIFSVGMPAALRGPWKRLVTKEIPVIERDLPAGLAYRGHRLFSGVLTPTQLPHTGRIFFRVVGGRFGDYRDWDAIDAWTAEIAAELTHG
jgi:menaquinone-dependent protoporphyrinogen oxidase